MKHIRKIVRILLKSVTAVVLIALMVLVATSVSFIYDFNTPTPFSGPDIFNPYGSMDSMHCWKKANFHVHTRVKGLLNECKYWPNEVYEFYNKLGYDIVTFSNHNELTEHPFDSTLQVNVYEHGYNLFKFHKLVFGSKKVNGFDHLLPLFASQRQFQIDMLKNGSDIIQFNHPLRTRLTTKDIMEKVSGYEIIELDCGKSTENTYWDWALSAGHYSFGLANDDLHYPDRTNCINRRCNFICSPSAEYDDIKKALLGGCYYSMRIPDYGNGNWNTKIERNKDLPYVKNIGADGNSIFIELSQIADSIKVFGQGHSTLCKVTESDKATYTMKSDDPYSRFTVYFQNGEVIYSNPFARYDASVTETPFKKQTHVVNIPLTIIFNTILLLLLVSIAFIFNKVIIKQ